MFANKFIMTSSEAYVHLCSLNSNNMKDEKGHSKHFFSITQIGEDTDWKRLNNL